MSKLLISEAERKITLSEGGAPITMTAGQAVLRATLVSALKGNANAQRTFLQMTTAAQQQADKSRREEYQNALLTQIHVEWERAQFARQGMEEADMPRHPSDIELDPENGRVRSFLIYTQDAVEARKRAIVLRDHLIEKFPEMLEVAEQDGDDSLLELGRERASRMIDTLNEQLPVRFRRLLPHDVRPLSGNDSPEEIWQTMARDYAASLCNKAKQGEIQARRSPARKRTKPGE